MMRVVITPLLAPARVQQGVAHAAVEEDTAAALADEVSHLPGAPLFPGFKQFAGYLNATGGRHVFYWLVEAPKDAADKPLVYWTNGGPGCSGLLGLLSEQGPWRPTAGSKLERNPYAWNDNANVLFVENPATVGFSYGDDPEKALHTGDEQTADDGYHAILSFLDKFPRYASNDFFVSSESYGGHYGPTLAKRILDGNAFGGKPLVNLKGVFVGNPYDNPVENDLGLYGTWHGHQLVPKPLYAEWAATCLGKAPSAKPASCDKLEDAMQNLVFPYLNPYALDFPVCLHESQQGRRLREHLGRATGSPAAAALAKGYEPCEEDFLGKYLNKPDVQAALHVHGHPMKWSGCAEKLQYNMSDMLVSMQPVWRDVIGGGVRVTIYSGDDDSICGGVGTQSWIYELGFPVAKGWAAWKDAAGQLAGYVTRFETLATEGAFTYATVHTAGHEVPAYQPARAKQLFDAFLAGEA